ncbi:hypothetical protein F5146DRAFT_1179993 [Armillaria mellea]|nr:hypothetical protein F5146DRAFT_1179993 [Armillaria mellea]
MRREAYTDLETALTDDDRHAQTTHPDATQQFYGNIFSGKQQIWASNSRQGDKKEVEKRLLPPVNNATQYPSSSRKGGETKRGRNVERNMDVGTKGVTVTYMAVVSVLLFLPPYSPWTTTSTILSYIVDNRHCFTMGQHIMDTGPSSFGHFLGGNDDGSSRRPRVLRRTCCLYSHFGKGDNDDSCCRPRVLRRSGCLLLMFWSWHW